MNRTIKALIMTVFVFIIAVAAAVLSANVYMRSLDIDSTQTDSVLVTCIPVNYGSEHLTVDIQVPEVSGLSDMGFEAELNREIYDQIKTAARAAEQESRTFYDELIASGYTPWMFVFSSAYEVKSVTGLLSLKVTTLLDNGGPGMPHTTVYNVDIACCKRLRLCDLFAEGSDYTTRIDKIISATMQAEPERYFEPYDFAGVDGDTAFFVSEGRLYILFAKYELASGMSGEPVFEIETEAFKDLLKCEYQEVFK